MVAAMYELCHRRRHSFACPEGAATLVGYKRLIAEGFLRRDETTVLFNTGSGYKYLQLIEGVNG